MRVLVEKYTISEITFICVMAVIMGIIWSIYTFIYSLLAPIFKATGLEGLIVGIWLMSNIFFPYIIRKPGSALLGSFLASIVEVVISHWGMGAIIYAILQAIPSEILFFVTRYKRFNYGIICLSGFLSGLISAILSIFLYQYYKFGIIYCYIYLFGSGVSGIILGAILSKIMADKLYSAGVLNQYKIALKG